MCPRVAPLIVNCAVPHQSLIKTMSYRLAHKHSDKDISLDELPSPQVTSVWPKWTKYIQHNALGLDKENMKLPKLQQSRVKISVALLQDFHPSFPYLFLVVYAYVCVWWIYKQECRSHRRPEAQDPPGTGMISNHGSPGMEDQRPLQEQKVQSSSHILIFLSLFLDNFTNPDKI